MIEPAGMMLADSGRMPIAGPQGRDSVSAARMPLPSTRLGAGNIRAGHGLPRLRDGCEARPAGRGGVGASGPQA